MRVTHNHHREGTRKMKRQFFRTAALIFSFLIISTWAGANQPQADPSNLSRDLSGAIAGGDQSETIDVIIQFNPKMIQRVKQNLSVHGGDIRKAFRALHGMAVRMPKDRIKALAATRGIRYITPDRKLEVLNHITREVIGVDQLREYDKGWDKGKGEGAHVAIIDSGIYRYTYDIFFRVNESVDFVDYHRGKDLHGHGTRVAGILSGNGALAYFNEYDVFPEGVAPKATITNLRVLDEIGAGEVSDVIAAIDWVMEYNADHEESRIRVINLSLGHPVFESYTLDPMCQAVEAAVLSGVVVVCAAGNYGYSDGQTMYGGIVSPGNHPLSISVGATDTKGTVGRSDDDVAAFSSRGPTLIDGVLKPDIVAPGTHIMSLLYYYSTIAQEHPEAIVDPEEFDSDANKPSYMYLSGTSMAAPVVSGTVALMLEANPGLTPNLVKAALMYTAQKMVEPDVFTQGAGYLNAEGAIRLASSLSPNIGQLQEGDSLLVDNVDPFTIIGEDTILWGSGIFWGDKVVWSDGIFWSDGDIWGSGIIWDQGIFWGDSDSWIEPLFQQYQDAYGQGIFWGDQGTGWTSGTGPKTDNVVFGNGIFWGDQVLDPNSCGASSADEVLFIGSGEDVTGLTKIDGNSPYYPKE